MDTKNLLNNNGKDLLEFFINLNNSQEKEQTIKQYIDNLDEINSWSLISAMLLKSENLLKDDHIYEFMDEKQTIMLENFLEKSYLDREYEKFDIMLLNSKNKVINRLNNITNESITYRKRLQDDLEELEGGSGHSQYIEELVDDDFFDAIDAIGSNNAIANNGILDYKKLFIRIRNSIAHSNYEILEEGNIRLFHYNNENEIDFNIIIKKEVLLIIINELNDLSLKLHQHFFQDYSNQDNIINDFQENNISDEELTKFFLKYKVISKEEIEEIIKIANKYKDDIKENIYVKADQLFSLIDEKITEHHQYGMMLNEILDKNNLVYSYDMFGYYNFFSTDNILNILSDKEKTKIYLKIIILNLLNNAFLYPYNIKEEIDYENINFDKLEIDKTIQEKYQIKKYKEIENYYEKIIRNEKKLLDISESLNKLKIQQQDASKKNDYILKILPERIRNLEEKYFLAFQEYLVLKQETKDKIYENLFEITDINEQQNLNGNISKFIINHLRNSLAHGNIDIDILNINNFKLIIINFEDYEKENRELTFKATINLENLINIILNSNLILNKYNIKNK